MPIETIINVDEMRVCHTVSGKLTFDEIVTAMKNLFGNKSFLPEMDILVDVLPNSTSCLTSEDIHRVVEITRLVGDQRGSGRSVVVATEEKDFGILHVLEFLLKNEQRDLKVFKTREEAEQWLNK